MKKRWCSCICGLFIGALASPAFAQEYGIFDSIADWEGRGSIKVEGEVQVEGEGLDAVYQLWGNGDDIWDNQDEGLFLYTELEGSWSLEARLEWIEPGTNEWAKLGVMIREEPQNPESRHYWIEVRGAAMGDRVDAQWRTSTGGSSGNAQIFFPVGHVFEGAPVDAFTDGTIWLRVTRIAPLNLFISEFSEDGEEWIFAHSQTQVWPSDVAAYGLAITDHTDTEQLAHGQATNVQINPAPTVATRSFEPAFIASGAETAVTISVLSSQQETASISVTEVVPDGLAISNVSHGGTVSAQTITWNIDVEPGQTDLTYTVTAGDEFDNTFSGVVDGSDLLGDQSLLQVFPFDSPIFNYHMDIYSTFDRLGEEGGAEYDPETDTYTVWGSGWDIWDNDDAGHFVFTEVSGDFELIATGEFDPDQSSPPHDEWFKIMLWARQDLTAGSVNYGSRVRAGNVPTLDEGQFSWQKRQTADGGSSSEGSGRVMLGAELGLEEWTMRILREGDQFSLYYLEDFGPQAGEWIEVQDFSRPDQVVPMQDPIFVGLAVTAHQAGEMVTAHFWNVELNVEDPVSVSDWALY